MPFQRTTFLASWLAMSVLTGAAPAPESRFTIRVVDDQTGRGVPLVELRTTNNIRRYTDSNGIVAFHEPGLMNRKVFFYVDSHGYEYPQDGFGYRGKALQLEPGGSATLKIKRTNLAERLYRITGGGIYRDSRLVGEPVPLDSSVSPSPWTSRSSTPWSSARTASSTRSTGARSTGSGEIRINRATRWATSTSRGPRQSCRLTADSTRPKGSTSTTSRPKTDSPNRPPKCPATARRG